MKLKYRRALVDISILFIASTFLHGYFSLITGILLAVTLSFTSVEKLYDKNFIFKNKKYIFVKNILYVSYVVTVWFAYNHGYLNILYGFWIGVLYATVFIYMKLKEEVSE